MKELTITFVWIYATTLSPCCKGVISDAFQEDNASVAYLQRIILIVRLVMYLFINIYFFIIQFTFFVVFIILPFYLFIYLFLFIHG
jgi:hypothetical protein